MPIRWRLTLFIALVIAAILLLLGLALYLLSRSALYDNIEDTARSRAEAAARTVEAGEDLDGDDIEEFTLDGTIRDTYVLAYVWDVAEDSTGMVSWTLVRAPVSARVLKAFNGSYTLEVSGTGTAVTYRLSIDVKIPGFGMLRRKAETIIIDTALEALKKHIESASLHREDPYR